MYTPLIFFLCICIYCSCNWYYLLHSLIWSHFHKIFCNEYIYIPKYSTIPFWRIYRFSLYCYCVTLKTTSCILRLLWIFAYYISKALMKTLALSITTQPLATFEIWVSYLRSSFGSFSCYILTVKPLTSYLLILDLVFSSVSENNYLMK